MKDQLKKLIASVLAICTFASMTAPSVFADWKQNTDKTWIYIENNKRLTGWQQIKSTWYYFDSNGIMQTDWQKISNIWYYLKPNGAMAVGWQKIGSDWYYLRGNGAMATGWQKVGDYWYYLRGNGTMVTGWQKVGSNWYYLKPSGAMATGWVFVGDSWYYMDSSGAMVTGWLSQGDKTYYLQPDGRMATGQITIDGTVYTFDENGVSTGSKKPEDLASEAFAKEVLKLVNQQREAAGKKALTMSSKLTEIAKARCVELQKNFSHTRPDGSDWYTIFPEYGLAGAGVGENIARYYYDASKLMNDLMNSAGHKANILSSTFQYIGIYYLTDSYGYPYIVQIFSNAE